ncbi:uncharacterized protein LOC110036979 [Phalaenopsis equestris]|uniref:uncharacterized protein LOC110036979 n=1 Tax=Phalaenopsis equestris TaxID=78828 RepID=UPI0009E19CEE|nr:uncharacterized protein LOC110036979 [Phalaenopsis equestris]
MAGLEGLTKIVYDGCSKSTRHELWYELQDISNQSDKALMVGGIQFTKVLEVEEIKEALDSIDSSKVVGPDGFTTDFYKKALETIKEEVIKTIQYFIQGNDLPDHFSAATIIFLPKSSIKDQWHQFGTISLTNVIKKIIEKVFVRRLQPVLKKIICPNQTTFVKGTTIGDNVLLGSSDEENYAIAAEEIFPIDFLRVVKESKCYGLVGKKWPNLFQLDDWDLRGSTTCSISAFANIG